MSTFTSVEILKQKLWFYNDWREQNLHRPKIPKIPDEQSAGFMHRPKIPKNPKIFRNYQARPWQSSKKSWDLGILGLCMNPALRSSGILGILGLCRFCDFKDGESSPDLHRPRFPRFLMNKVQDSCTGPKFPTIPRFLGTIRQDPGKVPKNLGIPQDSWWTKCRIHAQAQDSQESQDF